MVQSRLERCTTNGQTRTKSRALIFFFWKDLKKPSSFEKIFGTSATIEPNSTTGKNRFSGTTKRRVHCGTTRTTSISFCREFENKNFLTENYRSGHVWLEGVKPNKRSISLHENPGRFQLLGIWSSKDNTCTSLDGPGPVHVQRDVHQVVVGFIQQSLRAEMFEIFDLYIYIYIILFYFILSYLIFYSIILSYITSNYIRLHYTKLNYIKYNILYYIVLHYIINYNLLILYIKYYVYINLSYFLKWLILPANYEWIVFLHKMFSWTSGSSAIYTSNFHHQQFESSRTPPIFLPEIAIVSLYRVFLSDIQTVIFFVTIGIIRNKGNKGNNISRIIRI